MADTPKQEIKLFYCYARRDKKLLFELDKHLTALKRQLQITSWYDGEITPGKPWENEIKANLDTAKVILLLISSDFLASKYCYSVEMQRSLERHASGEAYVIPILIRPVYWENEPFSKLQVLPSDAVAITKWSNRDLAFQDVVTEISRTIKSLLVSPITEDKKTLAKIDTLSPLKNEPDYAAKIEAEILRVVRNLETKGQPPTFRDLKRYLTRISSDRLKTGVTNLVRTNQLSENKSGRSPRYTINAAKIEAEILRVVRNLETKGTPPTIRDLSRYLTRIDIDRLKMGVTDLVHAGQLSENKSGRSPRYTIIYESQQKSQFLHKHTITHP